MVEGKRRRPIYLMKLSGWMCFFFGVFSGIFNGVQCIGVEQEVERCLFWFGRKDVE